MMFFHEARFCGYSSDSIRKGGTPLSNWLAENYEVDEVESGMGMNAVKMGVCPMDPPVPSTVGEQQLASATRADREAMEHPHAGGSERAVLFPDPSAPRRPCRVHWDPFWFPTAVRT